MRRYVLSLFRRNRVPAHTGRIIKAWEHRFWGNSVQIGRIDKNGVCDVVGWLCNRPIPGDYIYCRMTSGNVGILRVDKVKYCTDPDDMFFADTRFIGYATTE